VYPRSSYRLKPHVELLDHGKNIGAVEFLTRFPGLCVQCGSKICACPAVPAATVGRMAKELDISNIEKPFIDDLPLFSE
jgi:hypothetical protein